MKSLTHICEDTDKELGHLGAKSGTLEKLAHEWIGDSEIVEFRISVKNDHLIIASRQSDSLNSNMSVKYKYSIHRFFPFGNKWHVSADIADKSVEEILSYLLNHFS